MSHLKLRIIRKRRPTVNKQTSSPEEEPEPVIVEESNIKDIIDEELSKDVEEEEDLSEYRAINPLMVPLKDIQHMDAEKKEELRRNHPNLAEYIFMTQREKSKYFHEKNLKFNKVMEIPGILPARKIEFKRTFEVKLFTKEAEPSSIKLIKSFRDKYDSKTHYS